MQDLPKKTRLFEMLSKETDPISLLELQKKLGSAYADRSMRRWLTELMQEGKVEQLGAKRGTRYRALNPVVGPLTAPSSCFSSESERIITQVCRPLYERMPVSYAIEWLQAYEPNVTSYLSAEQKSRLQKAGQRSQREDPAGTYAHQIFNRLLIDLSYNSSRLEGNTYSLLDTQKLLLEGASAEGKLDEEKVMILNHKEAIRYLVDTAPRLQVDRETICTLHYLLSDGLVEPQHAGKVRNHAVRIGGSAYIPLEDPKQIEVLLERIAKKAALIKDPFEQSFFLLIHVTYLQAFTDVNKRTGRLSSNIPLIKKNLVPHSFNDVEREDYTTAMIAVYELREIRPLVDLYVFSYLHTCALYDSTVKTLGFDEIRVRYRIQRRALLRDIILQGLVGLALQNYVAQKKQEVRAEDQSAFVEDLMEDLRDLDELDHWKGLAP
jgi:hypothetical protein